MFIQSHIQWFVIFVGCPTFQSNVACYCSYPNSHIAKKHGGSHLFPHHPWVPDISQDIPSHVNPSWHGNGAFNGPRTSKLLFEYLKWSIHGIHCKKILGNWIGNPVKSKPENFQPNPPSLVAMSLTAFLHLCWKNVFRKCPVWIAALALKNRWIHESLRIAKWRHSRVIHAIFQMDGSAKIYSLELNR